MSAQLTQPGNPPVPIPISRPGDDLAQVMANEGEPLDPHIDARTVPETFRPECALTFTVLARWAAMANVFGWYNVTDRAPMREELYQFIDCGDEAGTSRVLDIRSDSRYLGGEIGFFQATPEGVAGNCPDVTVEASVGHVYYSEKNYNPGASSDDEHYTHLLIMDSRIHDNSFYFAWEDLYRGGDNDFTDLVMRVDGIQCTGGGEPCDTELLGVCAHGRTQCRDGELTCVQSQQPSEEECNGFDDNCDGTVDEGDLCAADEVCDRGRCVPTCNSASEFGYCPQELVCTASGLCVPQGCENVECAQGERCIVGGDCIGICEGIQCPFGQECRVGRCVDPCDGITCEGAEICDEGVCVLCQCRGCLGDKVCNQEQTACVQLGCEAMTCSAGTHCEPGAEACIDDCEGAVCPEGHACEAGGCVALMSQPPPEKGGGAGNGGPMPGPAPGSGKPAPDAGVEDGEAAGAAGSAGPADLEFPELGCKCTVGGTRPQDARGTGLLLMVAASFWYVRRRRSKKPAISAACDVR